MGAPSFKDCVAADIHGVFLNTQEFADTHTIDGRKMDAVVDDDALLERDAARGGVHTDGTYRTRRLLYVAITRAEKHCLLSCAQYRFRYGRLEFDTPSRFIKDIDSAYITKHFAQGNARQRGFDTMNKAQKHDKPEWMTEERKDIAEHGTPFSRTGTTLRHTVAADRFSDKLPEYTPRLKPVSFSVNDARREETDLPAGINVGNVIEHQRFGIGTVTNVEGGGESAKITVRFENTGTKQLLLKFAKYKILK